MRLICLALVFLFLLSTSSEGWTARTYQLVVVKSLHLMPASFRNIMLRHKEEILKGSLRPDDRQESTHLYDLSNRSGFLQDRVLLLTAEIPKKISNHVPFREIAVDFGRLSHYMSDLNDPLLLGDGDSRESQYRADFAGYLEKNIENFPWIFDGHEHPLLKKDLVQNFIFDICSNNLTKYPLLGESYFPNGTLVSSETFDPKSLPFGIASLSYSHSITNTVQIWFYAWKKAHGDTSHTPFYRRNEWSQQ